MHRYMYVCNIYICIYIHIHMYIYLTVFYNKHVLTISLLFNSISFHDQSMFYILMCNKTKIYVSSGNSNILI